MIKLIFLLSLLLPCITLSAKSFRLKHGEKIGIHIADNLKPVAYTASEILEKDLESVFDCTLEKKSSRSAKIIVTADSASVKDKQGFKLEVCKNGVLTITGNDSHGAAYGMLEISRLIGVSPWEWWADATPEKMNSFELPEGFVTQQHPDVEFRGIFINDEDWGLMPWSSEIYEPGGEHGQIGPKTNARIFELLLRLRANTYWPAMHECTIPFFMTEGNRKTAQKYGIYIGGSHCEPMACNTAGEWSRRGVGDYDYVNNSREVYKFWEDRVKDVAGQEILYTIGMRGVHDGAMNGAKTVEEQKAVLAKAFSDQRELLSKYVNSDITQVPQVFIPYKEVLDIYNAGLKVPEDVTLMWCDDNYGYIRHFPTEYERSRLGGNGIYYHVSYWGRPHDYLWLGTFSPGLLFQQMNLAYDKGIKKMWILNVGDIKPAEYQIELFMDMAWCIDNVRNQGVRSHLKTFLQREFGEASGEKILPVMEEHYRLAFARKPEFMGNTREEEWNNPEARIVKDLPWSEDRIDKRLNDYKAISDIVEDIERSIPYNRKDTYFQLVKYPVQAAYQMNLKTLGARLARHGKGSWQSCDEAFDSIASLTAVYNKGIGNNGKWMRIMDFQPRKLPVFERIDHNSKPTSPLLKSESHLYDIDATCGDGDFIIHDLIGSSGRMAGLIKGKPVTFNIPGINADSIMIELHFLPTHSVGNDGLSVNVTFNSSTPMRINYQTYGRSEEWKENVLENNAVRRITFPADSKKLNILEMEAQTEGVLLDRILVFAVNKSYPDRLEGKTLCVFGDSYVKNHSRPFSETWHAKAAVALGMKYVNSGINGNAISVDRTKEGYGKEMTKRYLELPDSIDVLLVIAGHNDASFVANENGNGNFRKSLDELCKGIKERYPHTAVGFVLPWTVDRPGFKEVIADIKEACLLHGFSIFDAEEAGGIKVNDSAFRHRYFQNHGVNDTAHLNDEGHNRIVEHGIKFIQDLTKTNH